MGHSLVYGLWHSINMRGAKGLAVRLKSGKVLIGSQRSGLWINLSNNFHKKQHKPFDSFICEEIEFTHKVPDWCQNPGHAGQRVAPGVTTKSLDALAETFIRDHQAKPGFLGLYGCPSTLLTSVNDAVVHGLPTDQPLKEGDIVAIDCGVLQNGFYGDHAYTFEVGEVAPEVKKLLEVTKESSKGIRPLMWVIALATDLRSNNIVNPTAMVWYAIG